ncbi:HEPN domain-containing protein [Domibacillus epiphyticus]|uniref:RiboL-PSP-HEPN domain-containing protein n=1 Tax=Domibacillus epiphyticus TaxID=1714355 RepID=A0A1V2A872_9BACI|nr:HEPN domain-containing protein [Domibacillus epiphyticus]OMP67062.1 hypothetical protein BTO28_08755 [Domibacillus epiphyticus]
MKDPIEQFDLIITDTRHISSVYDHFNIPEALDDLLRWQWIQAVSALDKYIHDIVKKGLIHTFNKELPPTKSYSNFLIPIAVIQESSDPLSSFEQFVIKKLAFQSYQTPDKITEALSLIWPEEHKWQKIADALNDDQKVIKNTLNLIAQRRNQIVHQGDYPSDKLEKEKIALNESEWVIDFIENLVHAIHDELESCLHT